MQGASLILCWETKVQDKRKIAISSLTITYPAWRAKPRSPFQLSWLSNAIFLHSPEWWTQGPEPQNYFQSPGTNWGHISTTFHICGQINQSDFWSFDFLVKTLFGPIVNVWTLSWTKSPVVLCVHSNSESMYIYVWDTAQNSTSRVSPNWINQSDIQSCDFWSVNI